MPKAPRLAEKVDYHEGIVRTTEDCHNCSGQFVARINYDLDGDHRIVCPRCGHVHFRTIVKGVMTQTRWSPKDGHSRQRCIETPTEKCWRDEEHDITTTTPSEYIRKRFIDR